MTDHARTDQARKLYEQASAGWLSALPWDELSAEAQSFWQHEAMKREAAA